MLDWKQAYGLKEGDWMIVGRKGANPEAHIVLGGIGIKKNHAYFQVDKNGDIILCPHDETCKEGIKVNGVIIKGPTKVTHNDRIVFGTSNAFLFKSKDEPDEIDFEFIANEIMERSEKEWAPILL